MRGEAEVHAIQLEALLAVKKALATEVILLEASAQLQRRVSILLGSFVLQTTKQSRTSGSSLPLMVPFHVAIVTLAGKIGIVHISKYEVYGGSYHSPI